MEQDAPNVPLLRKIDIHIFRANSRGLHEHVAACDSRRASCGIRWRASTSVIVHWCRYRIARCKGWGLGQKNPVFLNRISRVIPSSLQQPNASKHCSERYHPEFSSALGVPLTECTSSRFKRKCMHIRVIELFYIL
ncbi:d3.2 [Ichnoviriform fugitivi]|uniref:D3.2 n=1 Tax=Ichnoviriform fugitivi TaxID=265522 RepID=A2Q0K3_9VIRU|nr:d3.2 [Ichnoviriform fugitivi]BAF45718.1 d3.2 [Ichnoviriform fugitivi]